MNRPSGVLGALLGAVFVCCLPGATESEEPTADKQLIVKAWRKQGTPGEYKTRILRHLEDFNPKTLPQYDQYGGWMGRKHEATGFFYSKRIDGRWWLIDPEGYRFLHLAVNSVRPGDSPQNRRAFAARFATPAPWREATVELLEEHGFNGTGCWSDDELLHGGAARPVYTPTLRFISGYGKKRGGTFQLPGHTGYPNGCVFAFDPEFETFADQLAKPLGRLKDDP